MIRVLPVVTNSWKKNYFFPFFFTRVIPKCLPELMVETTILRKMAVDQAITVNHTSELDVDQDYLRLLMDSSTEDFCIVWYEPRHEETRFLARLHKVQKSYCSHPGCTRSRYRSRSCHTLLKFSRSLYLDNQWSESIHNWTIGTL